MKQLLIALLIGLGAGYYLAKKFTPPETQIVEKEVIKDRIITVIKHKKNSDGSEETETVIDESKQQDSIAIKTERKLPDWGIAVQYDSKLRYGIQIDRRVLGPLSVQIGIKQDGEALAGLRYEF